MPVVNTALYAMAQGKRFAYAPPARNSTKPWADLEASRAFVAWVRELNSKRKAQEAVSAGVGDAAIEAKLTPCGYFPH